MAFAHIQTMGPARAAADPFTVAFTSNTQAASLIVACVRIAGGTTFTATDTHGNTYTAVNGTDDGTVFESIIWALNATAGANTLSLDLSALVAVDCRVSEFTYGVTPSVEDTAEDVDPGLTAQSAGSITTTGVSLAVAAFGAHNGFTIDTPPSNYVGAITTDRQASYYRISGSGFTDDAALTTSGNEDFHGLHVAFQESGGVVVPSSRLQLLGIG